MNNINDFNDIDRNVPMEEISRFVIINDRKAKLTNMFAIKKMNDAGYDYKTNLLELKKLDDEYRNYVRLGNCDNDIIYQKRLKVAKKLEEIETVLRRLY